MPIVADTHVVIWYYQHPDQLSPVAVETLDRVVAEGDSLMISAISIVEICYLIERNRIPAILLDRLRDELQRPDAQLVSVALGREIALAIPQIDRAVVPDMPDRIIAATAYHLGLPLVTRDRQIQVLSVIQTIW